jgi:hypothetical protein
MSSPALNIPDLSSTRSRDLTRHEMNHLSVLLVSALVFDDEPSPLKTVTATDKTIRIVVALTASVAKRLGADTITVRADTG